MGSLWLGTWVSFLAGLRLGVRRLAEGPGFPRSRSRPGPGAAWTDGESAPRPPNPAQPYVPTPAHVGWRMLQLAQLKDNEALLDLGCGDGRLLVEAARNFGAHATGFELNAELAALARANVRAAGVEDLAKVVERDARQAGPELRAAAVVTLYLSERGNRELLPLLARELPDGARVVSFSFPVGGCEPDATATVDGIRLFRYDAETVRAGAGT